MSEIIEGYADVEIDGSWQASISISPTFNLTEESYNKYFDKEAVSFNQAKSILENDDECLSAYCLNDLCRSDIKAAILEDDSKCGTVGDFNWKLNTESLIACDQEIGWDNIDGDTRAEIISSILDEDIEQNDFNISETVSYSIDTKDISTISGSNGELEGMMFIGGEECYFSYDIKLDEVKLDSDYEFTGLDNEIPIPGDEILIRSEELASEIKEACKEYIKEQVLPSLDERLAVAEEKAASQSSDTREIKNIDNFDR